MLVAALAGAAIVVMVALAACGGGGGYTTVVEKIRGAERVVVGTKWDQPSLGLKTGPGDPVGFDVDVARYVVNALAGGEDVHITWRESPSSTREALLQNGTVDMIVATYAITEARKPHVTFAGPYVLVEQDTMVRADETQIKKVTDLRGKRICLAEGSNSYRRVVDPPPDGKLDLPAELVPATNYSDCVRKLADGRLDAISTQNLILAGFAEAEPGRFRLLNDPFHEEKWAVGLKKGDTATCEAVNRAIAQMWRDGTATRLLHKWFGKTGLRLPSSLPRPEGCP
ncbi:amino acid ABC transporter substrate-binding protein (PAAT family) [Nonomuraea polychroma]|uniref:Amino acid ABC transporter substrate-binding protein (PAAT family) n=1 Tax=Nonomuraea polychroma TaxID=46176 RepID=A0A438LXY5_9ACTN|nr:glutamate ABC transporter substrate-binding protein [Nonomuraea polychroma]RVX38128.1 amino acid ABC transporter substrate-binding protein (PAAT family) [Nonomuraea polychroma]